MFLFYDLLEHLKTAYSDIYMDKSDILYMGVSAKL